MTLDAETYQALRQLQELLRHRIPNGDLATIVKDALLLLLAQVKRDKLAQVKRPRKMSGQSSWVWWTGGGKGGRTPATFPRM